MRKIAGLFSLMILVGCGPQTQGRPPPIERFYFPTGIEHLDAVAAGEPGGSAEGYLYVASSNFDKRYDYGYVNAIDLSQVGLPAFPAAVTQGPTQLEDLQQTESSVRYVQSFAGQMASALLPVGSADAGVAPTVRRLFVPSRAEGDRLQPIDVQGAALSCAFGAADDARNCIESSPSLSALQKENEDGSKNRSGLPRAPQPIGVAVSSQGAVYVTHMVSADSPPRSRKDPHTFVVRVDAASPEVTPASFIELGGGATHGVVIGRRYAFVSGRFRDPFGSLVRLIDVNDGRVLDPTLEALFHVREARGVALSPDESRLYVIGRFPDTLLVISLGGSTTEAPQLSVVRSVPLPEGSNALKLIARPGQGNLVAITSSTAGVVTLYDDDTGNLAAQINGVGAQPFDLAVDLRDNAGTPAARMYVSNFGDGRVAVVDIPDLSRPQTARVVAHLGRPQTCLVKAEDPSCEGVEP